MKCIICGTKLKGKNPVCPKCHFDMSEQLDTGKKDPYQLRTFDPDYYLDALQVKYGLKKASEPVPQVKNSSQDKKNESSFVKENGKTSEHQQDDRGREQGSHTEKTAGKRSGETSVKILLVIALIVAAAALFEYKTGGISKLLSKNKTISGIASKTGLFPALESEADSVNTQSQAGDAGSQQGDVQILQETTAPQATATSAVQETSAPQTTAAQETAAPQTAADDTGIHFYEMVVADVTWDQAYSDCINRGGYLVRINTEEEFNYLTDLLEKSGYEDIHFFIGGRRDSGGTEYRWVDTSNSFMGDMLNSSSSWTDGHWMANEPSFKDGDVEETVLCLFKYEGAWRLNDVPNDTLAAVSYYSGKIGYICEYE